MNIQYRFLSPDDFSELYETNLKAFSDYLIPLQLTRDQFKNHIAQNAVDLKLSVGAFSNNKLVGYSLTGLGEWNGKKTAYDAGTGVIPEFRRKGVGRALFDFMLPVFKKHGFKQMLLEVISNNEKAISLYRQLGFEKTRDLLFFEQVETIEQETLEKIQIRPVEKPDWETLKSFCDRQTSWQFSTESLNRKITPKTTLGAFYNGKCLGYGVLFQHSGTVAQIAVDKNHRKKCIATKLLTEMQTRTKEDKKLRFSNVDSNLKSLTNLLDKLKFKRTISQFEMLLNFSK